MSTVASLPSSSRNSSAPASATAHPQSFRSATSSTTATASSSSSTKPPLAPLTTVDRLTSDLSRNNLTAPLGGEDVEPEAAVGTTATSIDTRSYKEQLLGIGVSGVDTVKEPGAGGGGGDEIALDQGVESCPSLATLLARRVLTHGGESVLVIGKERDGSDMPLSPIEYDSIVRGVRQAAKEVGCEASVLVDKRDQQKAWIMLRLIPTAPQDFVEIRVACVGNVDAGKSTTLGVLTKGGLDDGRGKARVNLFRHKHEIESGRTSSVGMELLGLTSSGEHVMGIVGSKEEGRKLSWEEVCARSAKIVNFLDLAGHERYLRTTIGGLTANLPEYGMLMVGANAGLIGMSKEHLGVALALSIPVFVTITKIDMCPPQILEATIKQLSKVLRSPGCRKAPIFVENMEQVVDCALRLGTDRICPIFQISNVTGHNLDLLRNFLNVLPQSNISKYDAGKPFELQISDIFSVPFVGTTVSGVITSGTVKVGDSLLIGPDSLGQFIQTAVRSIQRKRVNVDSAVAGQSASFALKRVRRNQVRKGMVMMAKSDVPPHAYLVFDAEILCLHHATTLSVGSCMVLHAAGIRQTVRITAIAKMDGSTTEHETLNPASAAGKTTTTTTTTTAASKDAVIPTASVGSAIHGGDEKPVIRTGDRARLRLQFIRSPEFVKPGVRLITREGRTRLIGRIAAVGGVGPLLPPTTELKG